MNKRNIYRCLMEALADTPVVFLRGARQTGKTTLARSLGEGEGDDARRYVSLDSATALVSAREDPVGFLSGAGRPLTLDEVQRAPELMLAIKEDVDRERAPGRYLLTGSANVLALPSIADSLSGRMEVLTLYPLSQGEIVGVREDFIAAAFSHAFDAGELAARMAVLPPFARDDLLAAICAGGYPEVLSRMSERRRDAWFESYVMTLIERDARDISGVQDTAALIRVVSLLAARTANLFNQSEVSRSSGASNTTLSRYISLLEALFLIRFLPAWSNNLGKRLTKSPKLHLVDSGLAAHLCGASLSRLRTDAALAGHLFETFVAGELAKQSSWSAHSTSAFHYRKQTGEEVDLILEDRRGDVVGIEIKLAESVSGHDIKGLAGLRDTLGERFLRGFVVYAGRELLPLGERLFALPVRALWMESAEREQPG